MNTLSLVRILLFISEGTHFEFILASEIIELLLSSSRKSIRSRFFVLFIIIIIYHLSRTLNFLRLLDCRLLADWNWCAVRLILRHRRLQDGLLLWLGRVWGLWVLEHVQEWIYGVDFGVQAEHLVCVVWVHVVFLRLDIVPLLLQRVQEVLHLVVLEFCEEVRALLRL